MKIVNLGSGSKGNSTLICGEKTKILIDCGLNITDVENRLNLLEIKPTEIDAILITHEHIDHIKSVEKFANKYKTKIYAHQNEWIALRPKMKTLPLELQFSFDNNDFYVGDLTISSFELSHDANMCVGYSVYSQNAKFSIATDLGYCPESVVKHLKKSDVVLLEANHDENLLLNNPKYPVILKQRILSKKGHLSNIASAEVISQLVGETSQIVLGHLSEENNSPILAYNTVKSQLAKKGIIEGKNIFVDVAYQHKISNIFEIKK